MRHVGISKAYAAIAASNKKKGSPLINLDWDKIPVDRMEDTREGSTSVEVRIDGFLYILNDLTPDRCDRKDKKECKYYHGDASLKCAVNPLQPCDFCQDYEPK